MKNAQFAIRFPVWCQFCTSRRANFELGFAFDIHAQIFMVNTFIRSPIHPIQGAKFKCRQKVQIIIFLLQINTIKVLFHRTDQFFFVSVRDCCVLAAVRAKKLGVFREIIYVGNCCTLKLEEGITVPNEPNRTVG